MDEKNKKNKWKNKKILGCILTVIIMVATAAGIYFYMNRFDPVRYVQAVLDVSYKEETEEYSKMTGTSRKEAEAVFEKNLDVTMEKFHSSAISEELEKKYRILFTQIVRQVNYQIGESEKQKDGSYIVELEIRPVTLFSDTYETFQSRAEEYAQLITNKVMKGMEIPSEEEMQGQVYQIYYDVLNEALQEGIRYGDKKKLKLHVEKGEDGAYEIREKDRRKLDQLLVENAGKNSA